MNTSSANARRSDGTDKLLPVAGQSGLRRLPSVAEPLNQSSFVTCGRIGPAIIAATPRDIHILNVTNNTERKKQRQVYEVRLANSYYCVSHQASYPNQVISVLLDTMPF
jgi:hypothetical protein